MNVKDKSAVVVGGASGLGRATVEALVAAGARVTIIDLATSDGQAVAREIGGDVRFRAADVTDEQQLREAFAYAAEAGPVRATVHTAGRGAPLRVLDRDGAPASLEVFENIIRLNTIGTFNVLRFAAEQSALAAVEDGERGVIVLTASIAAFEGQIGQLPYAASKASIVGMTLVAARDLANRLIRVCTIAPGVFNTPLVAKAPQTVKDALAAAIPHPARLGESPEFAQLALQIIANPMLNGETIRLDGAMRMAAR